MTWMKRTALAFAAGAVLLIYALVPGSASPAGQMAGTAAGVATVRSGSDVIEVGRGRGGGRWHGRGGWSNHGGWGRHGHWGHWRHGGWRNRGGWWWGVPFLASPFLYDGYYGGYGYGSGRSCYWVCRRYHGPRYCRWHSRRYC